MSYPETIANYILDDLRIVSPGDLQMIEKIVWARRAQVLFEPLEGSEARLLSVPGNRSIITISTKENYRPRQRFSIAHELGHLEMHKRELNSISCQSQTISPFVKTKQDIELQANQFASCFLLPNRFVKKIFNSCEPSFEIIEEVANKFDVSLTAAGSRYMQFTQEPLAFVISKRGRIIRFIPSQFFTDSDLFIKVGEDVEDNTAADCLARGKTIRHGWHSSPATSWLRGYDFMRTAQVKEWSSYSERFNLTLSLIWIDEELYDEW